MYLDQERAFDKLLNHRVYYKVQFLLKILEHSHQFMQKKKKKKFILA